MSKKSIVFFVILLMSFFLIGCGKDEFLNKEGEVYSKEFRESEVQTEQYYTNGNLHTSNKTYPEAYIIYVRYKEDFGTNENAFYETKAFYVHKDIYEAVKIGDKYLYNEGKDSLTLEYILKEEVLKDD